MLLRLPVFLEIHRTHVEKRRVQALLVVPQQPIHDLVLGRAPGFKSHAMQALDLQRTKHRFAACVIPAIAPSTHGAGDPVGLKDVPEIEAGVLASAITMEQ